MTDTITLHKNGGMSFKGPEAVDIYRIKSLKMAIKMAEGGMMLTRGMSKTRCLKMATEYTGIKYKRTEAAKAMEHLDMIAEGRFVYGKVQIEEK
jgi:hypothetical protein